MIIITCSKCGQDIRIPDDKHIRFKCPNQACLREYEYKDGQEIKPSKVRYVIPLLAITVALIGSFFSYLFPIPLLLGIAWLTWWISASSKKIWVRALSSLSFSTAIGLSLLFLLQLALNFLSNPNSDTIPSWLLQLDDFLIWSRENLTRISEISFGIYVIIIATLLYIAFKKPTWKPVSMFIAAEEWAGKITAVLIVITSFTFFAPVVLSKSSDHAYYKRFKVVYREKLKQERRQLIADILRKQIEEKDTNGYALSLPFFYNDLKTIQAEVANVTEEAGQDASSIATKYWEYTERNGIDNKGGDDEGGGDGSNENLDRRWEEESLHWDIKSPVQDESINPPEEKEAYVSATPREFIEATTKEAKDATILADESVEALKAVCAKLAGGFIPGGETLLGKYIEEVVNAATEQIFTISKVSDFVGYFFNHFRPQGKIDFFSRIGSFWQEIRIQQAGVILKQKGEIERKQEALLQQQEWERQRAEREAQQIKEEARSQLEYLITKRADEILIENGGGRLNSIEFKRQLIEDYKNEISFNNLFQEDYKRIRASNTLTESVFQRAMRVGASVQVHPGPRATCPICAYLRVQ